MPKFIFSNETKRGTGWNREPRDDEFGVDLKRNICPTFPSEYRRFQYVDNVLGEYPGWAAEQAALDLDRQEREIRARYAKMLTNIAAPYNAEERETWKTQEEEARLWMTDHELPCIMIRAMAVSRGITVELLVEKIIANADKFRAASGQILGMQQAEIDLISPGLKEEV